MDNIKVIFIDLFGVLIGSDHTRILEYVISCTTNKKLDIYKILFGEKCMELERGEINFSQYFQYIQSSLGDNQINFFKFSSIWNTMIAGVLPMESFIDSLKNKYRLFILTNTTQEHVRKLEKEYQFFNKMHGIITSDIAGYSKPDKQLFSFAAHYCNVKTSECVFIDDSINNIKAAEQQGMFVHQYQNHKQLKVFLSSF